MMKDSYDVIIVGGGPAGSTLALYLSKKGIDVLLVEKEKFPRDKICGDGIGGRSLEIAEELEIKEKILSLPKREIYGVTVSSPSGKILSIDFPGEASGYVIRRKDFDNVLFQEAKKSVDVLEGYKVVDLIFENGKVTGIKAKNDEVVEIKGKIIVGADGVNSTVASKVNAEKHASEHFIIAFRQYWKDIGGMEDKIEMHFVHDVLPGYFWIFPLDNSEANVGIGMLQSEMKKKGRNLPLVMKKIIKENALFAERFSHAEPLEEIKGWGIPLASKRRRGYGNGYLLIGDACSLVNPFTGGGIGEAMFSAKLASIAIEKALEKGDFSTQTLSFYDHLLRKHIDPEMRKEYIKQLLARNEWLVNFVIEKALKKPSLKEKIARAIGKEMGEMLSPSFFLELLLP